jgi:large subunit ribosomal protein L24
MSVHLSNELRKKYLRRSFPIRKGDKVKVLRGQFKGRENKVEEVILSKLKVHVTGIERSKKDGSKSRYSLEPSNLMITELNLDDKKRKEALERKISK